MINVQRTRYLDELDRWKDDTGVVKVILGVRCAGKSEIIRQFVRRITDSGIDPSDILYADFESSG